MNPWNRQSVDLAQSQSTSAVDAGLRSYMLKVYNTMASGVLLTAIIAYFAGNSNAFLSLMVSQGADGRVGMSGLGYIIAFAPLAMVFFMMFRLNSMSTSALKTTFWVYASLVGLSFAPLFLLYTGESIARVLFMTAGTFGLLSMVGYTTKRDLTSMGTFLFVGAIAVFLSSIVNMLIFKSSMFQMALSALGVVLALGFTAYDTQKIKEIYYQVGHNADALARAAALGALNLYMDFVYLFINLLQLLGDRR